MAVLMQAFYWDAPIHEKKEGEWWNHIAEKGRGTEQVGSECTVATSCLEGLRSSLEWI